MSSNNTTTTKVGVPPAVPSSRNGPPNYHRLEKLGKGSFATVYRAVHIQTNQEAAVKHISQEKLTLKLQENLESEISILKNHSHRNIVRLYDIERNDKHIFIILEYCRGGDLQRFIKNQPGTRLSEVTAQHFLRHLAAGLKFLNDRNLVHRDIKPQNLLLTENSPRAVLKIADFGFARHLEGTCMAETLCGSPLYMAPEILSQNQYNAKADLWSVGAVLFEMVAGRPPFAAQNQVELLKVIKRPLQIPSDVELSGPCVALLQRLLKREPLERISFEDFFQDAFIDMKSSGILLGELEQEGLDGGAAAAGGKGEEGNKAKAIQAGATAGGRGGADPNRKEVQLQQQQQQHHNHHHEQQQRQQQNQAAAPFALSTDVASAGKRVSSMQDSPFLIASHTHQHPLMPEGLGKKGSSGGGGTGEQLVTTIHHGGPDGEGTRLPLGRTSLPFQPNSNKSPVSSFPPNPRVNPFKPLAASPPGAVALSHNHARSSSSTRRASFGGPSSMTGSAEETVESDGFVIINSVAALELPSTGSSSSGAGGAHQAGGGHHFSHTQQNNAYHYHHYQSYRPPGSGSGSGSDMQHHHQHYPLSSAPPVSSSSSGGGTGKSTDSVEGALRVLTYVESSTRRAILIASLGDAKAIAGLSARNRGGEGGNMIMMLDEDGSYAAGRGEERRETGNEGSSTTTTTSSSGSASSQGAESADAKAFALLVDALVLYLKALSVVGTAIKALRQVIDVIQTHFGSQQQQGSGGAGGASGTSASGSTSNSSSAITRLGTWQSASLEERSQASSLQDRIASLRDWLELHFSIILDRAQECRLQIDRQQSSGGRTTGNSSGSGSGSGGGSAGSQSLEGGEGTAAAAAGGGEGGVAVVTRSAEELLYKHALSLAKEGAVKELLGQWARGMALYSQAKLMMEALLAEPLLPMEDQQTLERYVEEFRAREEELAAQCRYLEEEKVAASGGVGYT